MKKQAAEMLQDVTLKYVYICKYTCVYIYIYFKFI